MKFVVVCVLAGVLASCSLPFGTGAPMSATTVGHGQIGLTGYAEAPTLDLTASGKDSSHNNYTDTYARSAVAAVSVALSYGLTDNTDLEVAAEGAMYLIFPLPDGGSIGLRHHMVLGDNLDFALAGQVGGMFGGGGSVSFAGSSSSKPNSSAIYGAVQAVVERRHGDVQPLAALNLMPFRIDRHAPGGPEQRFAGLASSLTFGVAFGHRVQLEPYVVVTGFTSAQYGGGAFVSGGLMVALREPRHRAPPPPAYGLPPSAYPPAAPPPTSAPAPIPPPAPAPPPPAPAPPPPAPAPPAPAPAPPAPAPAPAPPAPTSAPPVPTSAPPAPPPPSPSPPPTSAPPPAPPPQP